MSWTLYDRLLEEVDREAGEERIIASAVGRHWCLVKTESKTGIAMVVSGEGPRSGFLSLRGKTLSEAARQVKSWNFLEASLGMAAINAALNTPERVAAMGGFRGFDLKQLTPGLRIKKDAFTDTAKRMEGKKVAVIGHFPDLERAMEKAHLSILERAPLSGDLPDSACEYVLPHQDAVYITGTTLINKTLPRLLTLCQGVPEVFLVGPSLPFSRHLLEAGVHHLSGYCALEPEKLLEIVLSAGRREIFEAGLMVDVEEV